MPKPALAAPAATLKAVSALTPQELIDEGGKLDLQFQQLKPTLDRFSQIKKRLQVEFERQPAGESGAQDGVVYQVQYTAREFKRTVDEPRAWKALRKLLAIDKLLAALKPPLSLIDEHFSPQEQESFVEKERTGGRDLTFVPKAQ